MDKKYSYDQKTSDDSEAVLSIKVEKELFDEEKEKVFKRMSKNVKLKGFRPGTAPKNMIEASIGPSLYEETLNQILPRLTYEVISELKLEPITRIDYEVDKFEKDGSIEFKAKFTVYPQVKIGKLDKIKVEKEKNELKEEDIQKVLENMYEDSQKKQEDAKKDDKKVEDSSKDKQDKQDKQEKKEMKIDDKWVETLEMDNIKTLDKLKEEIKKTLTKQREQYVEEKYSADMLKAVIDASELKVPESLVQVELEVREKNYVDRIERLGLKVDDFLRNQKISLDDLKKDWRKEVIEKLEVELLLTQIIRENKFKVEPEAIEKEISAIQDEKMRKEYDTPRGRMQVESIMLKQLAYKWLKDQIEGTKK